MDHPFIDAWVASIPGIGPKRFQSLQRLYPNLSKIINVSRKELVQSGVPEKLADSIINHREKHPLEEIQTWCEKNKTTIITIGNDRYPNLLFQIPDPPTVLYIKGNLPPVSLPTIGVVGTRNITAYGRKVTKELTVQLVRAGFVIVSGFMYGVDAVAHEACIDAGGTTIAVLGYGLGVPFFPRSHDQLAEKLLKSGGCLITEFPPWTFAVPGNFPSRNRIVSGLSLGILVTEAAVKSGSRITASLAVDQGREVFAIPGPMHSQFSEGTKDLINMGAKLVTNILDITSELNVTSFKAGGSLSEKQSPSFSTEDEKQIYTYIVENSEATVEELIGSLSLDARSLTLALSNLELSGAIVQSSLGVFSAV